MTIFGSTTPGHKPLTMMYLARRGQNARPWRVAAITIAFLALLALTGCTAAQSESAQVPTSTVASRHVLWIAATDTANEPQPALPEDVSTLLGQWALSWTDAVVIVSGQPIWLAPRRRTGQLEHVAAAKRRLIAATLADIGRRVAVPATGRKGSNPLQQLQALARLSRPGDTLLLISSGLSTVDPFNLATSHWRIDPRTNARYLAGRHELPELAGRQVLLAGIGQVAGPQPVLPQPLELRLQQYWLEICGQAHARSCVLVRPDSSAGHPPTTTTPTPIVPVDTTPTMIAQPTPDSPLTAVVGPALFGFDSATLAVGSSGQLGQIAAAARKPGVRVNIVGHSDNVPGKTPDYNTKLSYLRAISVRQALLALGVPADRITVSGVGTAQNPATPPDDPARVASLRCVTVQIIPLGALGSLAPGCLDAAGDPW